MQTNVIEEVVRYEEYDFSGISASIGIYGIHKFPAMLHFKLVESLIDEFSSPEEIVYDPFCGSGTTGVVAIRYGRRFVGIDFNEDYLKDLAIPRIEDELKAKQINCERFLKEEKEIEYETNNYFEEVFT